jgi:hypothetical protein
MYLAAADSITWPESVALLGLIVFVMFLIGVGLATWVEYRKTKVTAAQEEALQQLVRRYEQLAGTSLDAQQRAVADMSELRSRAASIEKILRTVE